MTAQEPITVPFVGKDEGRHQKYDKLEDGGVLLLITPDKEEEMKNDFKRVKDQLGLCEETGTTVIERYNFQESDCSSVLQNPTIPEQRQFNMLVNDVSKKVENRKKTEFLVCVLLMTHDVVESQRELPLGEFDLAVPQDNKHCLECEPGEHKYTGRCIRRKIPDLVRSFQEAQTTDGKGLFSGKPKIFLIQTIEFPADGTLSERTDKLESKHYHPKGSDTFVFYSHSKNEEKKREWLKNREWFVLDELFKELERLREQPMSEQLFSNLPMSKSLKQDIEAGIAAVYLFENLFITLTYNIVHKRNKPAPYLSSTLRYKLYLNKILPPAVVTRSTITQ